MERMCLQILDALQDLVLCKKEGSRIFWANKAFRDYYGMTNEELQDLIDAPFNEPDYTRQYVKDDLYVFTTGNTLDIPQEPVTRCDGEVRLFHTVKSAIRDSKGKVVMTVGVSRDITEHKQEEREIIEAREEAERANRAKSVLLSAIPSILIGVDENDLVTQWSAAAAEAFGIRIKEVMGRKFRECPIQWNWERLLEQIHENVLAGFKVRLDDFRFRRPTEKDGILGITVTPLIEEGGRYRGFLLLAADITERKLLESQLAQAQKLESIGQLAAGIAHEINTPTQYIGDNTRFLQTAFADIQEVLTHYDKLFSAAKTGTVSSELLAEVGKEIEKADVEYLMNETPKAIQQSLEGIARVAKIVQAMKEFSHPGTEEKTAVDINRAIESTLTIARNEWKYVAELETDFDTTLPLVPCLPGDFNQVILNIIVNAAHAIEGGVADTAISKGKITIQTRREENWAVIRIQDSGTGIPEAIRSRVFDPFFTTKEVGKGTGQGLAIARSIVVDKHRGAIHFETETGLGTTFVIRLPLCAEGCERGKAA